MRMRDVYIGISVERYVEFSSIARSAGPEQPVIVWWLMHFDARTVNVAVDGGITHLCRVIDSC